MIPRDCIQTGSESFTHQPIAIVNPGERTWTRHRYVLCFGAYGDTRLMVWANSLEDALDEAVDWLEEHAPGLLIDDSGLAKLAKEAQEEDPELSDEEAWEQATVDLTCAGNHCRYLPSWEWGIVAEDPTREEILSMLGRSR